MILFIQETAAELRLIWLPVLIGLMTILAALAATFIPPY